jgi:hypothetical protein
VYITFGAAKSTEIHQIVRRDWSNLHPRAQVPQSLEGEFNRDPKKALPFEMTVFVKEKRIKNNEDYAF